MKYFLDTEFHEYKKKGIDTIELISIGIVNEEGKEYYAICNEFDVKEAWNNDWLRENVLKSIWEELNAGLSAYHKTYFHNLTDRFCLKHLKRLLKWKGKTKEKIAKETLYFCSNGYFDETGLNLKEASRCQLYLDFIPDFYAYYAAYDWVVFCWLFGRMVDLPTGFPMYCNDLKQMMDNNNLDEEWKEINCPDPIGEHNALVDATWNMKLFNAITDIL